jgi:hypothetical protein
MPSRAAFGASVLAGSPATGLAAEPAAGAAILEQLRGFGALCSVLYVAASFPASWSRAGDRASLTIRCTRRAAAPRVSAGVRRYPQSFPYESASR